MKTVFLRALEADDKGPVLALAVRNPAGCLGTTRFDMDSQRFRVVPGSPFAYWLSEPLRGLYQKLPGFGDDRHVARQGLATADDYRFVRMWWEVPAGESGSRWYPFAKGGRFSPFYGEVPAVVKWVRAGEELRSNLNDLGGIRSNIWMLRDTADRYFLRRGLTWTLRARRFAPQPLNSGSVFSVRGYSCFVPEKELGAYLGLFNSVVFDYLFKVTLGRFGFPEFLVGILPTIPTPTLSPADEAALASLARRAWSLKRSLDTRVETSHAFVLPALLQVEGKTLADRAATWAEQVQVVEGELVEIQAEIDERCFELYAISDEDRRAITQGFGVSLDGSEGAEGEKQDAEVDDEEEEAEAAADTVTLVSELVSWAAGVAFGRFDVRLATGAREQPAEPEPFDPLPVCSPGMLTGGDGMPLDGPPSGYRIAFPADGLLVDDPGHPRDIVAAVRAVFDVVFGPSADARWQEAAALLDPKGHDLRAWFRSSLFEHHLRRHSKSRRKAAILWQLAVPSGRYAIWCYAHRLTSDSLFALSRDLVAPKLDLEERRRTNLVQEAGPNPTARQRAEIAAQDSVVDELRAFAEEVGRVAPLWDPDLDDGIVLASAPLWRLIPHRAWQRELRSRWDDLAAGKCDWAHLAMHLWPERVVPKCADDRSLAIAHDLEGVFWVEDAEGKWTRRARPARSIEELVAERSSQAAKAALISLLEAPGVASGGRGRKSAGGPS